MQFFLATVNAERLSGTALTTSSDRADRTQVAAQRNTTAADQDRRSTTPALTGSR